MGNIRVSPEYLQQKSQDIKVKSGDLGDLVAQLTSSINALESEWEGQASASFINQWAELKPSFDKATTLLDEIGTQLGQTADAYLAVDAEIASKFS